MVRIEGTNLPQNKRLEYALTYIFGIGLTSSKNILNKLNMSFDKRVKDLTDGEIAKIQKEVATYYMVLLLNQACQVSMVLYLFSPQDSQKFH